MTDIQQLKRDISEIKQRNLLVEKNKAWETSYTRRLLLLLFTYLAIALYLNVIRVERPWIHAIVPAIGFLLSTLTLPFFKELWKKYIANRT